MPADIPHAIKPYTDYLSSDRVTKMYGIFDIALDSDIPLPELPEIETAKTIIRIRAGEDANTIPNQPEWFHHWKDPDGEVCISIAKLSDGYLLRFPELADIVLSRSGDTLRYFPQADVPVESIRHILLDQMIPRILGQRGRLVLHAAAVIMPQGQAIAFLGASGMGKSTLASSFHQNGARLITDDCLLLDEREKQLIAIPNYYGLRLFDDSATALFGDQPTRSPVAHYTSKSRLRLPANRQPEPEAGRRLNAIFLLADADDNNEQEAVHIHPIKGANELMAMIEQTFTLDLSDKSLVAHQFKNMGRLLTSKVRIYRLEYPRKHEMLPLVRSRISDIL